MAHYKSEADALARLDTIADALKDDEFGYIGNEVIIYEKKVERKFLNPIDTTITISIRQDQKVGQKIKNDLVL